MTSIDWNEDNEPFAEASALEHWVRVLVFLALFLGTLALVAPGCAFAHDWQRPELDNWYSHLQATGKGMLSSGASCCSKQDCHTTEAELRNGEWWARLGVPKEGDSWELQDWVRIPDEIIVRGQNGNPVPNQAGEAVICHPIVRIGNHIDPDRMVVYCFVPPDQS